MSKLRGEGALLPFLECTRASSEPMARQLDRQLRAAILDGRLLSGQRLPATRVLAKQLGISRSTVVEAFTQLTEEGYLESIVGSGSFVSLRHVSEQSIGSTARQSCRDLAINRGPILSRRGQATTREFSLSQLEPASIRPFAPNIPGLDLFPQRTWNRLSNRALRTLDQQLMNYGDAAGFRPLRRAAARYLTESRGVACEAEQVIVTSSTQRALGMVATLLAEPGDHVIVEDPGPPIAHQALRALGSRLVPVPVDKDGLDVEKALAKAPEARLVYLAPSCHYPLGVSLSISRRLTLLDWARRNNSWILEDDEDSEFRFLGRTVPAMQGQDRSGRVIYAWSFSEALFPSLRLGVLVLPPDLIDSFSIANGLFDRGPPTQSQAVLSEFINDGYLTSHVRRMRSAYAARRENLISSLRAELGGLAEIDALAGGLRVIARLPKGIDDKAAEEAAARQGITGYALSNYYRKSRGQSGLLLGFACTPESRMQEAAHRLAEALRPLRSSASRD